MKKSTSRPPPLALRLRAGLGLTEDPLTKLDKSIFPNPPKSASSSTALKERTRALVSARLDRIIPVYLQQ